MEQDHIWQDLLLWLRGNMQLSSYDTWIKQLSFRGIYGNEFLISTPNLYTQEHMKNQYTQLFSKGLRSITGDSFLSPVFVFGADDVIDMPNLNPRYTFDNFVVGSNSNLAYAAAKAIAEKPTKYNPFLIYGGPGLGKTHLMQAIGNEIKRRNPSSRILYVTCEEFTNDLIRAIQNKQNEQFRNRYRHVDVLLVDDIQFIAGKNASQEEFFHTFNSLYAANKQIVLTSDVHPQNMKTLEERLKSRFIAGLSYDIQLPDFETRVAILKSKLSILSSENVYVDDESIFFIANIRDANVRELEGYLTRVLSYSSLTGEPITPALCEVVLRDIMPEETDPEITLQSITDAVCLYYGLRYDDISSKKKTQNIAFARMVAMYLCRTYTDKSLKEIGGYYGGRDHTTVMHGNDKISEMMKSDASMRASIEEIMNMLRKKKS